MLVEIEGTIEEVVFSNEINGYTVCEIRHSEGTATAVGFMPFINAGESVKVSGKWVTHPEYGEQLKVELYEKLLPKTGEAVEKYLASGVVKGIGPATAKRIVDRFGDDTLSIIQNNPEKLSEIKGISLDKASRIGAAFAEQKELRAVVMFLQQYGISPAYSAKIYKTFGDNAISEIKANPYRLADEVIGIGFRTADRIARNIGVDPHSKFRVCSGIRYMLSQSAAAGHTFVPQDKLKEYVSQLLDIEIDCIRDSLTSLLLEKSIVVENIDGMDRVYLSSFHYAETGVSRKLAELSAVIFEDRNQKLEGRIVEIQQEEGIQLAEMQVNAVSEAMKNGVLVITGGPGTGKTTIIKTIIKLLQSGGNEVVLAAPTGRAAKRMSETTGFEARTIHRLLEIGYTGSGSEMEFLRTEGNPIDTDAVIIDETSMVDVLLMYHLLKAIQPGTRLILVGDADQLPSVGAGNVLNDIITSCMVKTVRLTEIFRQAEESMIIVNAHRINKGESPYLNRKDKDFFFIARGGSDEIVKTVADLCSRRLPVSYGYDPMRQIQVLTPTRKGSTGVYNLNIELQKVLNRGDGKKNEKAYRDFVFREGDKVMQIKNNYNIRWERPGYFEREGVGVFNGDAGIIQRIDNEEQRITVLFEDEKVVEYDFGILDELEPAFAITIHKSQGSEFPAVVLPVFPGPQVLMTRNLLYTAVTRARELVILVGSERTLYEMINNSSKTIRHSGLNEKLKTYIGGLL